MDLSEVKSIFGFCVRFRISQWNATIYRGLESHDVIWKHSVGQSELVMSVRLCWHCITWLHQNHSNSAICHLRNEKGTGAEMRPAIVSGILLGDTRLSLCFKTRVQSYWYENDFLYVSCKENSFFKRTIAQWQYFTTTTRIHFGFALLFKFVNPAED